MADMKILKLNLMLKNTTMKKNEIILGTAVNDNGHYDENRKKPQY